MKTFTYNQLCVQAKINANHEYIKGWLETHPDDHFIHDEVSLILESEEGYYSEFGDYLGGISNEN